MFYFSSSNPNDSTSVPIELTRSLDAIFVLGGGVPSSLIDPPEYVKIRCDAAANIIITASKEVKDETEIPVIVCLSAGTAHLPQLMSGDGLPIWEATSSAAYILDNYGDVIPSDKVLVETTSYDTISNAYFARTTHAEVAGWHNVLVVTSEFHMARSKAIFDWVFYAPSNNATEGATSGSSFNMIYLACENVGLSDEAIDARKVHEKRGEANIKEKLSLKFPSLFDIWRFLTLHHDFYSGEKLVARTKKANNKLSMSSNTLKESYGAPTK